MRRTAAGSVILRARPVLWVTLFWGAGTVLSACSGSSGQAPPPSGTVSLSGTVQDWRSGVPLAGAVVRTLQASPPSSTRADSEGRFLLPAVPAAGSLILDITSADDPAPHLETSSPPLNIGETNQSGITLLALSSADGQSFRGGFAVTESAGQGVILGRILGPGGAPLPGVHHLELMPVGSSHQGPYYLGSDDTVPTSPLAATSSGGGFLYFNVTPGNVAVDAAGAGYSFEPSTVVVSPGAWSLVDLQAEGGS